MTAYQVLPGLTAEEYARLREDIRLHGVRVPIDVDENGQVLDGHHRSIIAAELGVDCPRRTISGLTEAEKVGHAIAVNVHRRTLTREQRQKVIAESLKAQPELSDRQHAERAGASKNTVAGVRRGLESTGQVDQLNQRRGKDGKSRPAKVTHTSRSTEATKTEQLVDTNTGEIDTLAAIEEYVEADGELTRIRWNQSFGKAIGRARGTYDASIAHMDKLIALREMAPGTTCPLEAAERLGIDLDAYLGAAAS